MDECGRQVGHCHALRHRIAGVFLDGRIDPARLAIQPPPDFPVDHAVGNGAELLLALAQFRGHRGSQLHGPAAAGHQ